MPLVQVCTAYAVSEAIVIRSAFAAYGIRATLVGIEHCQQDWFVVQALRSIPVLVSDADYQEACALYAEAQRVDPSNCWLSDAFWRRPTRNAVAMALPWLCCGTAMLPWFRDWPKEKDADPTAQ